MERHSKPHKKSWRHDEREVKKYLSHWFNRTISGIYKSEIKSLHDRIGRENGLYQANRTLERIRAMYNKAIEWGIDCSNPANGIKKFKEKSRERFLQVEEIPRFFAALDKEGGMMKDFFLLLLFTGVRKSNMMEMRWEDIDLGNRIWKIPETKNGDPLVLPLEQEAIDILFKLKIEKVKEAVYVFPGNGREGHLTEPRKAWLRILKQAGIKDFRIHDLRRTLGSWQAMSGSSAVVIGKSLGHKSLQATAVYSRVDDDTVRNSISRAVQAMRSAAKDKEGDKLKDEVDALH